MIDVTSAALSSCHASQTGSSADGGSGGASTNAACC